MVNIKITQEPTSTRTHFTKPLPFKRINNFITKVDALNVLRSSLDELFYSFFADDSQSQMIQK